MKLPYERKNIQELFIDQPQTQTEFDDAFGAICWSFITEPGDQAAGMLLDVVGPGKAFEIILNNMEDPKTLFAKILEVSPNNSEIFETLNAGLRRWIPRINEQAILRAIKNAITLGVKIVHPGSTMWPGGFGYLGFAAPRVLWLRGHIDALERLDRSIAIVGSRAASGYGEHVTFEFGAGAVTNDIAVVSGGAYGIDGIAHRAALAAKGTTVAVLAGGIDRLYPSGHESLLRQIMSQDGLIIAEQSPGHSPSRWRFLQRNRLMAAMTSGTLVVEAGVRSGSLNTAGHAAQMGKPLGAVPGSITSSGSLGTHRLIREYDAECITTVEEMCEMLGFDTQAEETLGQGRVAPEESRILDQLGTKYWTSFNMLVRKSGMEPLEVEKHLAMLEFTGKVQATAQGWKRGSKKIKVT